MRAGVEHKKICLIETYRDADDDLGEYDLEHYDDDEGAHRTESAPVLGGVQSLTYYQSNAEDPYITLEENGQETDDDREELRVLDTDNMIVAAKVEDEVPYLEIYVYEDEADNLYVHHDIMLPAVPLCVEWLDLPVGKDLSSIDKDSRGNCVVVGTMDPDIEIWDLDTVDSMFPNAILGSGGDEASMDTCQGLKGKRKKRKKSKKANDDFHVDAVLSLAANRQHRNLLASCSADQTVKLWDLTSSKCAKSYKHHTDKVCSIAWHRIESTILLSGSYDQTVVASDMRTPDAKPPAWRVESDVETVMWDTHNSNSFYVTTESGILHMNDIRSSAKTVWTLQAHDEAISSIDVNFTIPGFLVTGSFDKRVKIWNVQSEGPTLVVSRDVGVGKVFSSTFARDPEVAFRLAVAGSKGDLHVWDTSTNAAVRQVFGSRMGASNAEGREERIIRVQEDSSDNEDLEQGEVDGTGG